MSSHLIFIGYYTVDCTIPKYIWTSAQMTTILDEAKQTYDPQNPDSLSFEP